MALNGYQVRAVQAAAGARCGTARFTAGLDAGNCLDPAGPVETRLVTIDSLIGGGRVAGMKVDVEGFELEVLAGCARALAEHRIGLIQLEWNAASVQALGTDRRPVAKYSGTWRRSRPTNVSVPSGSFALTGSYTATGFQLTPDHWISKPQNTPWWA